MYGIDWNAPFSNEESVDSVVSGTDCPLSSADLAQLCTLVNSMAETDDYGINHYISTVQFVQSRVH